MGHFTRIENKMDELFNESKYLLLKIKQHNSYTRSQRVAVLHNTQYFFNASEVPLDPNSGFQNWRQTTYH